MACGLSTEGKIRYAALDVPVSARAGACRRGIRHIK